MSLIAKYLGANGWLINFDNFNVIIDPWLKGSLKFPPGGWLIEGTLPEELEIPKKIDLILLTQGLNDHTHIPTLKEIKKDIPVIGSKTAARVARKIGFKYVDVINPSETIKKENLVIEGTAGANVPTRENGYIISAQSGSVYIEPHGYIDENMKNTNIDALITPVINIGLPFGLNIINGKNILPVLIHKFNPKLILASTTGGGIRYTGLLSNLIADKSEWIEEEKILNKNTKLIYPIKNKLYKI